MHRPRGSVKLFPVANDQSVDYYDILQISTSAEPDTVHRVYRLLAQRFQPRQQETGNESRFASSARRIKSSET